VLIRITKAGPGCVMQPGTVIKTNDKRAQYLVEQGFAVPTGVIYREDFELSSVKTPTGTHHPLVGEDITSIVIPVYNQPDYLELCLRSLTEKTKSPYELIIVDNGSDAETKGVISRYKCRVITNQTNLGFPKACNQGILHARGNRILLLNSDTVVTRGWLSTMVSALKDDVGIVGPTTNYSCGPQCDRQITSRAEFVRTQGGHGQVIPDEKIEGIADRYRGKSEKHFVDVLSGFCLLIDRRVISEVGALDLCFGMGGAEERDFEDRAIRQGWKMEWVNDSYVHHFGHKTLKGVQGGEVQETGKEKHGLFIQRQRERERGERGDIVPFFDNTPIMFPTWNRLAYTKQALANILEITPECQVVIYDDGSTDGTQEWLEGLSDPRIMARVYNTERLGLDKAIDRFFSVTAGVEWVTKVDNDAMMPPGWLDNLIDVAKAGALDICAPAHFKNHIAKGKYLSDDKQADVGGYTVYFNSHVGGLGVIRREWIDKAMKLGNTSYWYRYGKTPGGWTHLQECVPGKKAFYPDVHCELLDQNKNDYPEYDKALHNERLRVYGRRPEPQ